VGAVVRVLATSKEAERIGGRVVYFLGAVGTERVKIGYTLG
jgi:hypothetical protein